MDYRIEKMRAFRAVGFVTQICATSLSTMENGVGYTSVAEFFDEVVQSNKQIDILNLMNQTPSGLIGINVYNTDTEDASKFDYYIACSTDKTVPEGMSEYTVPAATWAVFPCKSDEVTQVEIDIVTKWIATSEYDLLNTGYESGFMKSSAPDLEIYKENGMAEVWVAVKQK